MDDARELNWGTTLAQVTDRGLATRLDVIHKHELTTATLNSYSSLVVDNDAKFAGLEELELDAIAVQNAMYDLAIGVPPDEDTLQQFGRTQDELTQSQADIRAAAALLMPEPEPVPEPTPAPPKNNHRRTTLLILLVFMIMVLSWCVVVRMDTPLYQS